MRLTKHERSAGGLAPAARRFGVLLPLVATAATGASARIVMMEEPCVAVAGVTERCPLWSATYDNPDGKGTGRHGVDSLAAVATSPDGTLLFATGYSEGTSGSSVDATSVAFDASSGATRWVSRYDAGRGASEYGNEIAASPSGDRVFVAGYGYRAAGGTGADPLIVAHDPATGAVLWSSTVSGSDASGFGSVDALAVSADGSEVFVAGRLATGPETKADLFVASLDAATGGINWTRSYDGPKHGDDRAVDLEVDHSRGMLVVTGTSEGIGTQSDFVTAAYATRGTATGKLLWVARRDGGRDPDDVSGLVLSPDASVVFVTGVEDATYYGDFAGDFATVAYDAGSGEELWSRTYDGPAAGMDIPTGLTLGPDGSTVVVAGVRDFDAAGSGDLFVIGYDAATGDPAWSHVFAGPLGAYDIPYSIASSSSAIYVTGVTDLKGAASYGVGDFLTIALDGYGNRTWLARYGQGRAVPLDVSSDVGRAVAVGPEGTTVYVGGSFRPSSVPPHSVQNNLGDYGVVAYRA